jgi:type IV pilus assembly protein PilW
MRKLRGMTMMEILVAMTITSIALAAAIVAANAQERAYYSGNRLRAAQNSARAALLYLEQKVALAGYGMDAPLALDFGWYTPAAALCPTDVAVSGVCKRDRVDDADELIFYARNPAYWVDTAAPETGAPRGHAWQISALSTSSITLKARTDDVFRAGQILQAVCSGELRYAYFTLSQTQKATADGDLVVQLESVDTSNPFRRQDVATGLDCVTPSIKDSLKVFQIDRYRFHVRPVASGNRFDPYLVLDTGTDWDENGTIELADEIPIAEGVEALQVGYRFAEPSIAIAGATSGTALDIAAATTTPDKTANRIVRTDFPGTVASGQFVYEPSSFYKHSLVTLPAARQTNAQGNIRSVLLSVVGRSPEPDATTPSNLSWTTGSPLFRQNQSAAPAWITGSMVAGSDGYQRAFADTAVNLPNMTTRTITFF